MSEIMALEANFARADLKKIPKLQPKIASMQFYKLHTSNPLELTLPPHSVGCLIIGG